MTSTTEHSVNVPPRVMARRIEANRFGANENWPKRMEGLRSDGK